MKPFYEQEITQDTIYAAARTLEGKSLYEDNRIGRRVFRKRRARIFYGQVKPELSPNPTGRKVGRAVRLAAWFHFTGRADESCTGKKLALLIDLNGEGCVYDENGSPYRD